MIMMRCVDAIPMLETTVRIPLMQLVIVQNNSNSTTKISSSISRSNKRQLIQQRLMSSMNLANRRRNVSWPWPRMNATCHRHTPAPTAVPRQLTICHIYPPNRSRWNSMNIPLNSNNNLTISVPPGPLTVQIVVPLNTSRRHHRRLFHLWLITSVKLLRLLRRQTVARMSNSQCHQGLRLFTRPWLIQRVRRRHHRQPRPLQQQQLQPLLVLHLGVLHRFTANPHNLLSCNNNSSNHPVVVSLSHIRPTPQHLWVILHLRQQQLQQFFSRISMQPQLFKVICTVVPLYLFHKLHRLMPIIVQLSLLHRPTIVQVVK